MTDPDEYIKYNDFLVPVSFYERALDRCNMVGDHYIWSGASCGGRLPQIGVKALMPDGQLVSKTISVSKLIWSCDMGRFPQRLYRTCDEWLCVRPDHYEERTTEE